MKTSAKRISLLSLVMAVFLGVQGFLPVTSFADLKQDEAAGTLETPYADPQFSYTTDTDGTYLSHGVVQGDTWNYPQTPNASFAESGGTVELDDEGYVIERDVVSSDEIAYLKKSASEVSGSQGLFTMSLDIKGNQVEHPIDVVLVIDFSSTMVGEKHKNALAGVDGFLKSVAVPLADGRIRVAAVVYNRSAYAMSDFSTDPNEILTFLDGVNQSQTGTFIQKGLSAAKNLFDNHARSDAQRLLIHIGDGSANCSYVPALNAVEHPNTGQITPLNGYSAATYITDFQVTSSKYYTSMTTSDPNAILTADKTLLSNYTLGSAIDLKSSGVEIFSIGVDPSARGEYTAQNLATSASYYASIDENLQGLSEALVNIASGIDKTIHLGTISDPMGDGVLLQKGAQSFGSSDYTLTGYRKAADGAWIQTPELVEDVSISEQNNVINLADISLAANERLVLTYEVRLNTEVTAFEPETWYRANKETTLDPLGNGAVVYFPIPSIKAPATSLSVKKVWEDTVEVGGPGGVSLNN
ncbi:MAG: vWA domain-containing protein, partial [Raoultibacter sp.]